MTLLLISLLWHETGKTEDQTVLHFPKLYVPNKRPHSKGHLYKETFIRREVYFKKSQNGGYFLKWVEEMELSFNALNLLFLKRHGRQTGYNYCDQKMWNCKRNNWDIHEKSIPSSTWIFFVIFIVFCFYCWLWTDICPLGVRSYSFRQ